MCLSNVTTKRAKTAKEDIIVYKILNIGTTLVSNWQELVHSGDNCEATIDDSPVSGIISIEDGELFICHNDPYYEGEDAINKFGNKFSWVFDLEVSELIVNNINLIRTSHITPYQYFKVEIGETYHSELIRKKDKYQGNYIKIGIHSYVNIPTSSLKTNQNLVECVIPKGSKYFIGDFTGINNSIASDTLKYVKIIK